MPETLFFAANEIITLTKNGVWMSDDIEITHEGTRQLFFKILTLENGHWFLKLGKEIKEITVEDTAYFVKRVDLEPGLKQATLTLAGGSKEPLKHQTLHYKPGRLTCKLANGFEAKFVGSAYFELLSHLEEDERAYFLTFGDERVELAPKS